eukprot:30443-Pelagococcus_subviridis.AAC.11
MAFTTRTGSYGKQSHRPRKDVDVRERIVRHRRSHDARGEVHFRERHVEGVRAGVRDDARERAGRRREVRRLGRPERGGHHRRRVGRGVMSDSVGHAVRHARRVVVRRRGPGRGGDPPRVRRDSVLRPRVPHRGLNRQQEQRDDGGEKKQRARAPRRARVLFQSQRRDRRGVARERGVASLAPDARAVELDRAGRSAAFVVVAVAAAEPEPEESSRQGVVPEREDARVER